MIWISKQRGRVKSRHHQKIAFFKKDAVFFHVLGVVATVIATIWMYAFGTGDPAEMRYFLGMPMWVSGAIVIYLAMFVVGMIWLVKWEEFPLTARFKKDSMNKKEGGEQA